MAMEKVEGTETLDALNPIKEVKEVVEKVEPVKTEVVEDGVQETESEVAETEGKVEQEQENEEVQVEQKSAEVLEKKPEMISKETAQARIDRMYARLQTEREKNARPAQAPVAPEADEYGETQQPVQKTFTRQDAEAVWDYKEKERKFKDNEATVLMRHPEALNDDGTFNMNDKFAKSYLTLGQNNPNLGFMIDGPLLAEAMIEKNTPKNDPAVVANKNKKAERAHTAKSTVAVSAAKIIKMTDQERKIARRMNMSEKSYIEMKNRIASGDKRVA